MVRSIATLPAPARWVLILSALLSLPPSLATAAPKPKALVDQVWIDPHFSERGIRRIAILPAVTLDGDPRTALRVAEQWGRHFMEAGYFWTMPAESRAALGATDPQRDSMLRVISKEVRDEGRLSAATAQVLSRKLDVDALLAMRIDRWERVLSASPMTYVDLYTTLVAADGAPLWRLAGRSRVSDAARPSRTEMPESEPVDNTAPLPGVGVASAASGSASSGGSSGGSGSGSGGGGPSGGSGSGGGAPGATGSESPPPKLESDRTGVSLRERFAALSSSSIGEPDGSAGYSTAVDLLLEAWGARLPKAPPRATPAR